MRRHMAMAFRANGERYTTVPVVYDRRQNRNTNYFVEKHIFSPCVVLLFAQRKYGVGNQIK